MAANNIENEEALTYCAVHPDRETGLRCITCNRYMCVNCAVRTPVGYRCRECVRGQQQVFFKAKQTDDVIAFAVCAAMSGVIVGILASVNLLILWIAIIVGLPLGAGISEVALRLTKRRRSRNSHIIATAGVIIGGIAGVLIPAVIAYNNSSAQYDELVSSMSKSSRAEFEASIEDMRAAMGSYPGGLEAAIAATGLTNWLIAYQYTLPEYMVQALIGNIGALLLIGISAAAVYSRYRIRM